MESKHTDNTNIDLTDEIRLAALAAGGSKEAFCRLYGNYKDKLYRYAFYRLGDPQDAEDAVSDCILAAWKGIPQLRDHSAFGAWIFRILHNCCVRRIRDAAELRSSMRNIYEADPASSSGSVTAEQAVELKEALACLEDDDREIVLLSVAAGLTSREISEITGLRPGSVRSRLSRSLACMRAQMGVQI